jgi:hypothetical protein
VAHEIARLRERLDEAESDRATMEQGASAGAERSVPEPKEKQTVVEETETVKDEKPKEASSRRRGRRGVGVFF